MSEAPLGGDRRVLPERLERYAVQTKKILEPLAQALLTAQPTDPAAFCLQYFQDLIRGGNQAVHTTKQGQGGEEKKSEQRASNEDYSRRLAAAKAEVTELRRQLATGQSQTEQLLETIRLKDEALRTVSAGAKQEEALRPFADQSKEAAQAGGQAAAATLAPAPELEPAPAVAATKTFGAVSDSELDRAYDVVVIGAGPAGVAAAVQAAFFGRRALLVDDPAGLDAHILDLGFGAPTGLFSKALRDSAKSIDVGARRAAGASDSEIWEEVGENVQRLATNNAETQYALLEEMRVDHLRGRATVQGAGSVVATLVDGTERTICGSNIVVATGSSPNLPKDVPFDGVRIFDCDTIAQLSFLPSSVVITGAGIIAIECVQDLTPSSYRDRQSMIT